MTFPELLDELEKRRREAERTGATASVAKVYKAVLEDLRDVDGGQEPGSPEPEDPAGDFEPTWADLLWLVPAERRIGTGDLLEALGRSRSWLYTHLDPDRGRDRIPHRKADGELVFRVGEVRTWIREREEVVHAGPSEAAPADLRVVRGGG